MFKGKREFCSSREINLLASLPYPAFLFSVRKGCPCDMIFQLVKSCKFLLLMECRYVIKQDIIVLLLWLQFQAM